MQELAEVHLFHNPRNVRAKISTSLKVPRPGALSLVPASCRQKLKAQ